ncbi:hypothetical protein BDN71DRAFT_1437505 [Pleurotus eryngii]|uniref:Uncharacterized protein n=1 Tax=Pleurotus eryngii TaxID=5323 RepID=A0A9P6DKA2_PLEER|nr:hypothetical protein BDN71DRAFT_1437505 [Pleurotus eryngii]
MSSRSVIIDNADAQIQYSPGWRANGSPNEYKRTTSNTETRGASFTFKFVGSSVAVYGTLDSATLPNTTYVLDGGNPFPFFGQPQPQVQYQQVFYTSPALPYAEHTLVGSCVDEGGRVVLDYLLIEIPLELPTSTSLPTPTSAVPVTVDSKPAPPTAAIVGGVLGGLLLLMTILASYLWYRQSRGTIAKTSSAEADDVQIQPLAAPPMASASYPMASTSYLTHAVESSYQDSEAPLRSDIMSTTERQKSSHHVSLQWNQSSSQQPPSYSM